MTSSTQYIRIVVLKLGVFLEVVSNRLTLTVNKVLHKMNIHIP